jgi:hypothetical protein
VEPLDGAEACDELGQTLASYFRLKEGRGHRCHVDVYQRGDSFYYFAFPEDYAETALEYSREGLVPRQRRPVFEVVFAYDPKQGALDTHHRGPKGARLELEKIFARVILQADFEPKPDEKIYDLNIFKRPNVSFAYDPASGIRGVVVKHLRFSLLGGGKRRITLETDPADGRDAMYRLVDAAFWPGGNGTSDRLSLALANVTRAGLQVQFAPAGRRGPSTKTFYLTHSNRCSLKHEGRDQALRQMLVDSGIEPMKAPTAGAKG